MVRIPLPKRPERDKWLVGSSFGTVHNVVIPILLQVHIQQPEGLCSTQILLLVTKILWVSETDHHQPGHTPIRLRGMQARRPVASKPLPRKL